MDFTFDKSIVEKIRAISLKFDVEYWREVSRNQKFPNEYWDEIARSEMFGLLIPKEYGGMGKTLLDLALATAETAERYSGLGSYLFLSACLASTLFSNSSEDQKKEILPRLAKGEIRISIALTEEESGLNATALETKAVKVSGGYRISGTKRFVNNVDYSDYLIVFARTRPSEQTKRSQGVSMFLVPSQSPDIRAKKLDKLGVDFINNFDLEIRDLFVNGEALVGEIDNAWGTAVESFNLDRVATAASLVGTGKLAVNTASEYARKRVVFGKPIGSNQGIQFPLADASAQLITAESLMLKAASISGKGPEFAKVANLALLESINAASYAADKALQTFGGHGYLRDYDVERYWRDIRLYKVHPISEELLLAQIAEKSLGLPKSY